MGKVHRTVIAHVPVEDTPGVISTSENLSENRENSAQKPPRLLGVEAGLVCPSEHHSISLLPSPRCEPNVEGSLLVLNTRKEKCSLR